jgi:hypothetical protein
MGRYQRRSDLEWPWVLLQLPHTLHSGAVHRPGARDLKDMNVAELEEGQ